MDVRFVMNRILATRAIRRKVPDPTGQGGPADILQLIAMAAMQILELTRGVPSVMKGVMMFCCMRTRGIGRRTITGWQTNSTVMPVTN
jgi:hypothetical protein